MKRTLTLILLLLISSACIYAQDFTLRGVVSDETGALPGVSVQVQGTNTGTTTNLNGEFTLKVKQGDQIVFSFIAMKPKWFPLPASSS